MVVTDEQVAALRAYLVPDLGEAERLNLHLVTMGGQDGYGHFVYAAFVEAVRNRFSRHGRAPTSSGCRHRPQAGPGRPEH
jgi:hypothetical protein